MQYPIVPFDKEFARKSEKLNANEDIEQVVAYYSQHIAKYGSTMWYPLELGHDEDSIIRIGNARSKRRGPDTSNFEPLVFEGEGSNSRVDLELSPKYQYMMNWKERFVEDFNKEVGLSDDYSIKVIGMGGNANEYAFKYAPAIDEIIHRMPGALENFIAVYKTYNTLQEEAVITRMTAIASSIDPYKEAIMEPELRTVEYYKFAGFSLYIKQLTRLGTSNNAQVAVELFQLTFDRDGSPVGFEYASNYPHDFKQRIRVPFMVGYLRGEPMFFLAREMNHTPAVALHFDRNYFNIALGRMGELVDYFFRLD